LLIAHDVIKLTPAVLIIYPSLLIADFILYSIGRKYGRMIVEHKRFSKIVSPATLSKLEEKFTRWGALTVFLGRHIVGFRAPIFLISGVMRIPRAKFLIADGLSAIITISFNLGLGYLGGNSLLVLRKDITRVDYILILALIILVAGWIFLRYFRDRVKTK
jgi:membrane protein DedA with SNARE-associated domain